MQNKIQTYVGLDAVVGLYPMEWVDNQRHQTIVVDVVDRVEPAVQD